MVGLRARTAIAAAHRAQVQAIDHFHHKPRKVLLGQPFIHRRRQQISGVAVNRAEVGHPRSLRWRSSPRESYPSRHRRESSTPPKIAKPPKNWDPAKSDRLLVAALRPSSEAGKQRAELIQLIGAENDTRPCESLGGTQL